ncbi:MAG: serpin family protein [Candidatus Sericytochromatia bacterium]
MQSKKICALILAILLNSCTTQTITGQNSNTNIKKPEPTPTQTNSNNSSTNQKPNPIINQEPIVISPNPTPTPAQIVLTPFPTIIPTIVPTPIPTASPPDKTFTLTAQELKEVTDSGIVTANNKFGVNLFLDLVKEQKNENIFISPASVALALQMTYNGADQETKTEMAKALEVSGLSLDNVNNLSKLLIKKLNNPAPDVQLKVANSLWGGKGRITFKDEFKNNLINFYGATSKELDFSDSKSLDIINQWASDNTNEKIPKVIDEIPPEIITYLMNAIYFKANWTTKFKTENTLKDSDFNLSDGTKKKHPLMSDFRSFRYINYSYDTETKTQVLPENQFEGAELTYGKDGKVSLFLFLPNEKSSLEKFYSNLNNENLEKWLKRFYYAEGRVSFPKFKLKYKKQLKENLKSLGMVSAFNDSANFTKMGTSPLGNIFISFVSHDTFVDVNEEGTEAAAVTVVGGGAASSPPPTRFVADRPFFYLIRDNETKSILFMGAVNNPEHE